MQTPKAKAAVSMKPLKCSSENRDYILVELSPQETLVEFSNDSSADPNNWTLVSFCGDRK